MKLGGFALKKGKKKALGASAGFSAPVATAPQSPEKVFVTDFDPNAPAQLSADGQKPLVIPLLETNAWKDQDAGQVPTQDAAARGSKHDDEPKTADQLAAAEILAETQTGKTEKPADLVIPAREQKRAELFQDAARRPQDGQKQRPILQQNAVPGLDELQDVTDKYRRDVSLRPEAPDVHSEVYDAVPVEAFGAALLRGMGWTGDVDPDDVGAAPQPRHKLLGLGATKRPEIPGQDKKKRRKKRKDDQEKQPDRPAGLSKDPREVKTDDKERRRRRSRSPDRERRRSRSHDRDRGRERGRDSGRDRDRGRSDRHSRRR
jgi:hypothetical protein